MRIIHTSDLHLDSPLTTRLDSNKVKERKGELLLSFKRLAEMAEAEGAEAVMPDLIDFLLCLQVGQWKEQLLLFFCCKFYYLIKFL